MIPVNLVDGLQSFNERSLAIGLGDQPHRLARFKIHIHVQPKASGYMRLWRYGQLRREGDSQAQSGLLQSQDIAK